MPLARSLEVLKWCAQRKRFRRLKKRYQSSFSITCDQTLSLPFPPPHLFPNSINEIKIPYLNNNNNNNKIPINSPPFFFPFPTPLFPRLSFPPPLSPPPFPPPPPLFPPLPLPPPPPPPPFLPPPPGQFKPRYSATHLLTQPLNLKKKKKVLFVALLEEFDGRGDP